MTGGAGLAKPPPPSLPLSPSCLSAVRGRPSAVAFPTPVPPSADEILAPLNRPLPPVAGPVGYRRAAAGVAVVMVALPVLYLAFIAAVVAAVAFYAVHGLAVFGVGSSYVAVLLYVTPLFTGLLTVVALVKPLFAPRVRPSEPVSLAREEAPLLFALVERLTAALGAPTPTRIDVDCRVNASAGFRRGLLSLAGTDLVLTVGLPLAAGLPLRPFAGVLAHEFGHFTQRGAMRLTYLTERVSHWFERVVYERDRWDLWLEDEADGSRGWITFVFAVAVRGVALGRLVLRGLMNLGRRASRGLLRRMEFDADRYAVTVAGTAAFVATDEYLAVWGAAADTVIFDLDYLLRQKRLPDDLPAYIAALAEGVGPADRAAVLTHVGAAHAGPLSTHPSPAERRAAAERMGAPGLPFPDLPARALFADFDATCRRATAAFYREALVEGYAAPVVATAAALAADAGEREDLLALRRLVADADLPHHTPVDAALLDPPPGPPPPATVEAARAAVETARSAVRDAAVAARSVGARLVEVEGRLLEARQAQAIAEADAPFNPAQYGVARTDPAAVESTIAALEGERGALEDEGLAPFHAAVRERLRAAFAAAPLVVPAVDLPAARVRLDAIRRFGETRAVRRALNEGMGQCSALLNALHTARQTRKPVAFLPEILDQYVRDLRTDLLALRDALADVPHPLPDGSGSLGHALVEQPPAFGDIGALLQATVRALNIGEDLHVRLWSALARDVQQVEDALGLPRLPLAEPTPPTPPFAADPPLVPVDGA